MKTKATIVIDIEDVKAVWPDLTATQYDDLLNHLEKSGKLYLEDAGFIRDMGTNLGFDD
jgi:hypothetical protein